jgi:hypothetical protein
MKSPLPRRPLAALLATALLAVAPLASADEVRYDDPSFTSMVIDGAIARPLGLGATVVGTAVWIVTLPFSALGGNVGEAADRLVIDPARFTFVRPLGEL